MASLPLPCIPLCKSQLVYRRGKKPESTQASGKSRPKESPGDWRKERQAGFSRLPGSGWVELRLDNQHRQGYWSRWHPQLDIGTWQYTTTPAPRSSPHPSSSADRACLHSPSNLILQTQSTQLLSKYLCGLLAKTSSPDKMVQLRLLYQPAMFHHQLQALSASSFYSPFRSLRINHSFQVGETCQRTA